MIVEVKALKGGNVSIRDVTVDVARVFDSFKEAGAWLKAKGFTWVMGSQGVWTNADVESFA